MLVSPGDILRPMEIPVRVLRPDATLPVYAHEGDAGCDLVAVETRVIKAGGGRAMVSTGCPSRFPRATGDSSYRAAAWPPSTASRASTRPV